MNTIDELKAQLRAAKERDRNLQAEWDRAKAAALERERAVYEPDCLEAKREVNRLCDALEKAESDAIQAHPWEGEKVQGTEAQLRNFRSYTVYVTGVVETYTLKSANLAPGSKPQLGEVFIRLLKRDGKPGAKYKRLFASNNWRKASDPYGPALEIRKFSPEEQEALV